MPESQSNNPNLLRDRLANERTFLAWLRTGITITALGFVVARFEVLLYEVARIDDRHFNESEIAILIGLVLVSAGPALVVTAAIRYFRADRALREDRPRDDRLPLVMVGAVAAGLGITGLGILAHLIAAWPT